MLGKRVERPVASYHISKQFQKFHASEIARVSRVGKTNVGKGSRIGKHASGKRTLGEGLTSRKMYVGAR